MQYYLNQAGSGIAGFQGVKHQRGHGFFGSLFSKIIQPLAKYLGKQVIKTGVGIGQDFIAGENIKSSVKRNLKSTGKDILSDAITKASHFNQSGEGIKRKKCFKHKKVFRKSKSLKNTKKKSRKSKSSKRKSSKNKSRKTKSKKTDKSIKKNRNSKSKLLQQILS